MQSFLIWSVLLFLTLTPSPRRDSPLRPIGSNEISQRASVARQLAAVRGEIIKVASASKGLLLITIKPAKEFQEVTVLARENDLVGAAVGRSGEADLLGLLSDDPRDDETITAAELNVGDVVSVIYDPQLQNRVLEIYLR
jgi:DNA-directed RNA polymerase subunit H (RpoH/RPB5)